MRRLMMAAVALALVLSAASGAAAPAPAIAAASDLRFALEEAAAAFTRTSGERVSLVFGSSGTLARQLLDGAPFELFLSADEAFVFQLADAGVARDRGALYAVGRLVVFAPTGSPLEPDGQLEGLRALLARGGLRRFAIANPEHAPYGRAAEAALRATRLWDPLRPFLVLGENISQAAQFASAGDASGGLIAYSLVLAPPLRDRGRFALVPETLHPPLRQRMALMTRAGPVAARFFRFLQQPAARAILTRYGFALPGE